MPKRTSKKLQDATSDFNVIASQIVGAATEEKQSTRTEEALAIIEQLKEAGFLLIPRGNDANIRGPHPAPDELLEPIIPRLKEYWPEILEALAKQDPTAVALGRLGGLKGGKARAAKLSAKKRKEIAKKAAQARWSRKQ